MASVRGQILYYLTALGAYRLRRRGEGYYIKLVSDIWKKQAEPAVVPSSMMGDPKLDITEWLSGEEGRSDRWQIFTIKPKVIKRKRLVVYFHGGAFCLAAPPGEWAISNAIAQAGCPVVLPIWTLAPNSYSQQFAETAVECLASIVQDEQWADYEIVLSGGSAGGWCAQRCLLVLCEQATGSDTGAASLARRILHRVRDVVLLCPLSDFAVSSEDLEEAGSKDPLLAPSLIRVIAPLWAYGPAVLPALFDTLPAEVQAKASVWKENTSGLPLSHPQFSPVNGLDAIARYTESVPGRSCFEFHIIHGTADILHPQSIVLNDRLNALGSGAASSTLHSYDGMPHTFPFVGWVPEAQQAQAVVIEVVTRPRVSVETEG